MTRAMTQFPEVRARNFLLARLRWIVVVTLCTVLGAAAYSWSRTPVFRSSAEVLVQPRLLAAGTTPQAPDMGSEAAVAQSTAVLTIAARALGVTEHAIGSGLSVTVPLNTFVLDISYSSTDPAVARQRAQAVATAYVAYWIAQQPPLDAGNGKSTQPILKSTVITPASLPSTPASPNHMTDLLIAVAVGLALGVGMAYLRDRLDDRVRGTADLDALGAGPVLAALPRTRFPRPAARRGRTVIAAPASADGLRYADLARTLYAFAAQRPARSVLITSPAGDARPGLAVNLAAALAFAGHEVILVCAEADRLVIVGDGTGGPGSPGETGDPTGLGRERARPALPYVVDRSADKPVTDAVQGSSVPGLRVLPAEALQGYVGGTSATGALRQALRRLSASADIVLVDGPPVLDSPDAAPLADAVDLVLLGTDARRTTRAEVAAATVRLQAVHGKLVGSVLGQAARRPDSRPRSRGRGAVPAWAAEWPSPRQNGASDGPALAPTQVNRNRAAPVAAAQWRKAGNHD